MLSIPSISVNLPAKESSSSHTRRTPFMYSKWALIFEQIRDSIVVSIPACHAGDPGSIPGRGVFFYFCHIDNFDD